MDFKNILPEPNIERIEIRNLIKCNFIIPECQREKEWDNFMYFNAIDSLVKNIDIGQIIVSCKTNIKTKTNAYEIIDGQHRYEAIKKFISNEINIFDKNNNKFYFNQNPDIFLNKKITLCKYDNLSDAQKSQLYMRINSGLEQNIEHMEKVNDTANIKEYLEKYNENFVSKDFQSLFITTVLYILNDYYMNGEANVVIKNLTKKNHLLKILAELNEKYDTADTKDLLSINNHILKELLNDKYQFYNKIKQIKKIKSVYMTVIIYHIFLENYTEIKNKSFVFNESLDQIYFKLLNNIQKTKSNKIKDLFAEIIRLYDLYKNEGNDNDNDNEDNKDNKDNKDNEDSSDTEDSL